MIITETRPSTEDMVAATDTDHSLAFGPGINTAALMAEAGVVEPAAQRIPVSSLMSRDESIVDRAEKGESLSVIAREIGVSRERVRQIVAKASPMSEDALSEARTAFRAAQRQARTNVSLAQVQRFANANPEATISMLAEMSGEPKALVVSALDWTEQQRRADVQAYPTTPQEDVLAEIRRVAALDGGQPLTGSFYDTHREGGLSRARLLQRFGTWAEACTEAEVMPGARNSGRVYTRQWSESDMLDWVLAYLRESQAPTYARFEQWLRSQSEAPSAQTIRNTLGSWVEMKRSAITLAAS